MRSYDLYQKVRVRNFRGGVEKWIPGTVVKIKGPLTYVVRLPGNNHRIVHADHMIADDSVNLDQTGRDIEGSNQGELPVTI